MRVNIYAEEMPDEPRLEIITKEVEGHRFTALRIYLELPVTKEIVEETHVGPVRRTVQVQGPFIHRPGDDDSAAVTFWGKRDLRVLLRRALVLLDAHYQSSAVAASPSHSPVQATLEDGPRIADVVLSRPPWPGSSGPK